ncbi:MAG: hypothetical protein WC223_05050 [Bacteroidales bacterium]|jgi:hypothetical protein
MKPFEIKRAKRFEIKKCGFCSKEFVSFRKNKKYCSHSCRQKSYISRLKNKKIEITLNLQCPKSWLSRFVSWLLKI